MNPREYTDATTSRVRPPAVSGLFYTAKPEELKHEIGRFIDEVAPRTIECEIDALVVPHAGYMYSGRTAAHAYHLLASRRFETIVILSPSHREWFSGASVYNGAAYRTPLGIVTIDTEARTALITDSDLFFVSESGHRNEHAIEVQLPFIQHVAPSFALLPIVLGDQSLKSSLHVAEKLFSVLEKKNALVIASTDLSHYHSLDVATKMDAQVRAAIEALDAERLMREIESNMCEACGAGPLAAAIHYAKLRGSTRATILHQSTSADASGDTSHVVGYISAAFHRG